MPPSTEQMGGPSDGADLGASRPPGPPESAAGDAWVTDGWLRQALDALQESFFIFEAIRDDHGDAVDLRYRFLNAAAERLYGRPSAEVLGRGLSELFPSVVDLGILDCYLEPLATGRPSSMRVPSFDDNGVAGAFDVGASPYRDGVVVTAHDVTAQVQALREAATATARYRLLAEHASDVVATAGADGVLTWVSPAVEASLGWRAEEVVGLDVAELVHPQDRPHLDMRAGEPGEPAAWRFEARMRHRDGRYTWCQTAIENIADADPDSAMVISWRDIHDVVASRRLLERRASHDSLTGLLNREEALEGLRRMLEQPERAAGVTAVAFCDIDDFKEINDRRGHAAGDDVLRAVAEVVQSLVRRSDLVARFGGDEILIVLDGVVSLDDAVDVAEKLRSAVSNLTMRSAFDADVTVSIGVAVVEPAEDLDRLIARADDAMYRAKKAGKNRVIAALADRQAAADSPA